MLFLGVDVGATKTHALVADLSGTVQGVGQAGAGNWESVGMEGAFATLQQAVGEALSRTGVKPGEVAAAGYGLAGLDWPSDEDRLRPVVARLEVGGPQILVNDSFVALRAGVRHPWGVVVIAGTGTTAAGRNRSGETARTLGMGYPFDDWGSAPDLARAAIHAVARSFTGRGPVTSLTERLACLVGARDDADLLERLSRGQYDLWSTVTEAVQVLFQEAEAGDAVAMEIVRRAGRELGGGAVAVIGRLEMEAKAFDVVLAGGVFRSRNALLLRALRDTVQTVAPQASLSPLKAPPVVGGVLMAMEAVGLEVTAEIQHHLEEGAVRGLSAN